MDMKGWRQKLTEAMFLLLLLSFVAHLMWDWMSQITPMLLTLALLAVIYQLIFRGRRR
jgi:hypothetical protein